MTRGIEPVAAFGCGVIDADDITAAWIDLRQALEEQAGGYA